MTYFYFQWIKNQEFTTMEGGKDHLISFEFYLKILGGKLYQCSLLLHF